MPWPPPSPEIGGNAVGLVEKVSRALVENITARSQWDEPAQLYWLELTAGKVTMHLFPIDQSVFDTGHRPTDVLAGLAREVAAQQDALRRAVPPGLFGLAFFCEAFAVTVPASADEWDDAARAAAAGAVPQHPDRVEQRMIYAVERVRPPIPGQPKPRRTRRDQRRAPRRTCRPKELRTGHRRTRCVPVGNARRQPTPPVTERRPAMSMCHTAAVSGARQGMTASPNCRPVPRCEGMRYLFGPAHWRFFERKHLGPHRIIARATKVCESFSI